MSLRGSVVVSGIHSPTELEPDYLSRETHSATDGEGKADGIRATRLRNGLNIESAPVIAHRG